MGRELTGHKVNGVNNGLQVTANDEPGSGGANHYYEIRHTNDDPSKGFVLGLSFQNGPIAEVGTNGLTHEALIDIIIDRLQGFQKGAFSCRENALAITKLEEARHWLQHRTIERLKRGVEGTLEK